MLAETLVLPLLVMVSLVIPDELAQATILTIVPAAK